MKGAALGGLALASLLGACSMAPEYHRPEMPAPETYKEVGDWKPAQPADAAARGAWWQVFGDPDLAALEARSADGNQDLKAALARLQQSRAAARYAGADQLPSLSAGASFTRQRSSQNRALFNAGAPNPYNDFLLNADLSYELDFWGRVRNTVSAAERSAEAAAADYATATLSIRAELAQDYFALRSSDAAQALLDQSVASYDKALTLTQNRYQGGAASAVDVAQAETQLQTARTQAAEQHLRRAQIEHAIAVLVGVPPAQFSLAPAPLAVTIPAIDPGLPSALLERRPDIASAERRVAAANAGVGVARAAYFPVFSLAAVAGYESGKSGNWIEAPAHLWSFGPSALFTLFDGGRRSANSDRAHAALDEAVAQYRQSVLNGYREVEDALVALHQLEQEAATQDAAAAAAQRALQQAQYRYKGGIATYLEVVSAQNAALQAQLATIDIRNRRAAASVLLVKALGGGWSTASGGNSESTVE